MRVFRPTYTIPRPSGAKVLERADGKWAKFTNARGQTVEGRLSKSGKRIVLETAHFHAEFRDHRDILRGVKLLTDEAASQRIAATIQDLLNVRNSGQTMAQDLQRRLEGLPKAMRQDFIEWGLLDAKATTATRPTLELVEAFRDHLAAKERTPEYISRVYNDLRAICAECQFTFVSDIHAGKVETFLKRRREAGAGYRRSNNLLMGIKMFTAWLLREHVTTENVLVHMRFLNVKQDRRHVRRVLEVEDLRRLLAVTAAAKERWGLAGYERSLLYRLAAETGLRANELRTLTVGAFHWDTLTIALEAKNEKARRGSTLPLRRDTAAELKAHFAGRVPNALAFKGVTDHYCTMLKDDLKEAGIPYADEEGRVFDFHALRHQCGTLLAQAGVHPKVAQQIMRHADINLTMSLYSHTLRGQESAAVAALPSLSVEAARQTAKTGTDGPADFLRNSGSSGFCVLLS